MRADSKIPSGEIKTDSTCSVLGNAVIIQSASFTASAIELTTLIFASLADFLYFSPTSYPVTSNPALLRLLAMGRPILPRPIKPTFFPPACAVAKDL